MGIVYVLTNPAFDKYVKIGKTENLRQRLKKFDDTNMPLPFRCVYAVEVEDMDGVERLLHLAFADHRTRNKREFFEVDYQRVIAAMKLTKGKDVTLKSDVAEDEEGLKALEKAERQARKSYTLYEAGLKNGDIVHYANDQSITAQITGEKKILFEGGETSLSAAAFILLQREGYTWKAVNGWNFWMFENETIAERLNRLKEEQAEDDE